MAHSVQWTGYWPDYRGTWVRIPAKQEIFSSPQLPDKQWAPPSILYNGYGVGRLGRGCKQASHERNQHRNPAPRHVRNLRWSSTPLLLSAYSSKRTNSNPTNTTNCICNKLLTMHKLYQTYTGYSSLYFHSYQQCRLHRKEGHTTD